MYYIEIVIRPTTKDYVFTLGETTNNLSKGADLYAEDCKFMISEVVFKKIDYIVFETALIGTVEIHPDAYIIGNENEMIFKAIGRLTEDWNWTTKDAIIGQQDLLDSFKVVKY
jgi:hypothetical protein